MKVYLLCLMLFFCKSTFPQAAEIDSLRKQLDTSSSDKQRVMALENLSYAYLSSYPDTAMQLAVKGLELARRVDFRFGEASCLNAIGNVYFHLGDNSKALEYYLSYLKLKEAQDASANLSIAYYNLASVYTEEKDYDHALEYLFKAKAADEKVKDSSAILFDLYSLSSIYLEMHKTDSALYYGNICQQLQNTVNDETMSGAIYNSLAEAYSAKSNLPLAEKYYRLSIPAVEQVKDNEVLTSNYFGLARLYSEQQQIDSTYMYGRKALTLAKEGPFYKQLVKISDFLTHVYSDRKMFDSAFVYQQLTRDIKDSMFNTEQAKKVQMLTFEEQIRQEKLLELRLKEEEDRKHFLQLAGIAAFIPMFFGSLLLLKKTRPNPKLMNFLALLTLLLFFEFILLLIHPLVMILTHESPVLILIVQVILAIALVPAHHNTQKWLEKILGDKPLPVPVKRARVRVPRIKASKL